jgi:hypothetical protein
MNHEMNFKYSIDVVFGQKIEGKKVCDWILASIKLKGDAVDKTYDYFLYSSFFEGSFFVK